MSTVPRIFGGSPIIVPDRRAPVVAVDRVKPANNSSGYEGARSSRLRRDLRDNRGPDTIAREGAAGLRNFARALERNHDVARGTLRVLVRNIIGATGITVEPMPRNAKGKVHSDFADQILRYRKNWVRRPEVTRRMDWAMAERKGCSVWLRDGELFAQQLSGNVAGLDHGTVIPYSLELLEPDLVPLDYDDVGRRIRQGIERNAWGADTAVWVYKQHPADGGFGAQLDLKRVPAERMMRAALCDRLHQTRGISLFCAVVNGLGDIKEIVDYEIAAAKIASAITGVINRDPEGPGSSFAGETGTSEQGRELMRLEPGMIFDGARAGETIQILDSKRPNSGLEAFIQFKMRNFAAGVDVSHSSISRNYDGTYSAQRQELVEIWESYRVLRSEWVGQISRPTYEGMLATGLALGILKLPSDIDPLTVFDAEYRGPAMPWIKPSEEVDSAVNSVRAGFQSLTQVVRERNGDPWETLDQIIAEREYIARHNLVLDTDAANTSGAGVTQARPAGSQVPSNQPVEE